MARTAQISQEKWQSIITLKHEGQSIWNISRALKVSSSAVAKSIKRDDETGSQEDHHSNGRLSSLELPASEIAAQRNASQSSSNRHISTSTVQRRLCESGLHGRIAAKKPLLKDTNKKKRLASGQETRAMDIRLVEICPLVWWVQIWDFWFRQPCLCETQSRWTVDLRKCGSHHEAWRRRCDGVGVLCWWHCQWFVSNSRHT